MDKALLNRDGLGVDDVFPKRVEPVAGCVLGLGLVLVLALEVEPNRPLGAGGWLLLDPNKLADDVLILRPPGPLADLERDMAGQGVHRYGMLQEVP